MTRRLLIAALLPVLGGVAAVAQTGDAPETRTLFEKLFPNPSGTNGYEEIVLAGERLKAVKAVYPVRSEFTLTKKRAYVADPACRAALSLLRRGVGKPLVIPDLDPVSPQMFAPFALLRSLARLLEAETPPGYKRRRTVWRWCTRSKAFRSVGAWSPAPRTALFGANY